jgi:hypothetical protein
LNSIYFSFIF